jgi:hypothetical protein
VNQVWSFAGERERNDVSQSTFEPVISYNFENGWFIGFDSTITADWNAPADTRWTTPVGLDAGKAFQIGKQTLSLQFGTYYNFERAEGAARWLVRFQLTLLFRSILRPATLLKQIVKGCWKSLFFRSLSHPLSRPLSKNRSIRQRLRRRLR